MRTVYLQHYKYTPFFLSISHTSSPLLSSLCLSLSADYTADSNGFILNSSRRGSRCHNLERGRRRGCAHSGSEFLRLLLFAGASGAVPPNADAAADLNFNLMRPWIPCQVISVRFHSDPATDQVFAKIELQPLPPLGDRPRNSLDLAGNDVVAYAKVLTRSDATNGGGFSVPRFMADMILPQLDLEVGDAPVQTLSARDTLGRAWDFRHIYRGTPRRHLLTTGWSRFVHAKSLVAGDKVVFMKKRSTNGLFVGIRCAATFVAAAEGAAVVAAAVQMARSGQPFEVVYYPKVGSPDFIVKAEKVKDSLLQIRWVAGMNVRMQVESEDASRMTLIKGVVTAAAKPTSGIWCGSPWRMLQVTARATVCVLLELPLLN